MTSIINTTDQWVGSLTPERTGENLDFAIFMVSKNIYKSDHRDGVLEFLVRYFIKAIYTIYINTCYTLLFSLDFLSNALSTLRNIFYAV